MDNDSVILREYSFEEPVNVNYYLNDGTELTSTGILKLQRLFDGSLLFTRTNGTITEVAKNKWVMYEIDKG